ncbi:hypothetical protein [Olleya sp. HaHaR_3_96]|uniref:hypothetical protein n=1 Tax=Olleya sp. HaHaR_3_96 TaxID=2745560 RepID=UPI001C4ECA7F|nr:hypothetical protein [Olleya sp. HaHaR_3_96]QXP58630.1 hypothetical protein H0I26_11975 [Olleya sp. HaHaR_3_96]
MTIKKYVINGLISGLAFAVLMAGWEYYKEQPFSAFKFVLHIVLFALLNGYLTYRKDKNKLKNE